MKIGVDIDEVLAVLNPDLTDFYNKRFKTNWKVSEQKTYRLEKFWQCDEDLVKQVVMDFYESPGFRKLKPVPGAKAALKKLRLKHQLFAITSRPDVTEQKTRIWIEKHFPLVFTGVHFSNHFVLKTVNKKSKSDICKQLGVTLMIDDHFDYAIDCSQNGILVLLMDASWNRHEILPESVTRVAGWKEITKILMA